MKIVITSKERHLKMTSIPIWPMPIFLIVDNETNEVEATQSTGFGGGGAGIQTAQFMVDRGVKGINRKYGPQCIKSSE